MIMPFFFALIARLHVTQVWLSSDCIRIEPQIHLQLTNKLSLKLDFILSLSAAWLRRLKRRFYGDRVITIAWSRFHSHLHRTHCCVLG